MLPNDLYEDMDPDYRSRLFYTSRKLLSSISAPSILPENELCSKTLLNSSQLERVRKIRGKRLTDVLDSFSMD